MSISIAGMCSCPHGSDPMQSIATATLLAGRGLEGDRYCLGQGTYSALLEAGRQLTLISEGMFQNDLFQHYRKQHHSTHFDIGHLRRNVVVRGLSPAKLRVSSGELHGTTTSCKLLVHRNCVPCPYNERMNVSLPGLQDALWLDMGVSCEILQGGTIPISQETRPRAGRPPRDLLHIFLGNSNGGNDSQQHRKQTRAPPAIAGARSPGSGAD